MARTHPKERSAPQTSRVDKIKLRLLSEFFILLLSRNRLDPLA